jgi:hypothetical protein
MGDPFSIHSADNYSFDDAGWFWRTVIGLRRWMLQSDFDPRGRGK